SPPATSFLGATPIRPTMCSRRVLSNGVIPNAFWGTNCGVCCGARQETWPSIPCKLLLGFARAAALSARPLKRAAFALGRNAVVLFSSMRSASPARQQVHAATEPGHVLLAGELY